ncbi:hypothetical protein L249_4475 [Ophiocordyceps polyrhachis-furcata BCC 54312]|uniref:Uncharacterized protein n=1 Tax=Ophiocordyceps polyrhachis-furcata BCC 54312 TaxID=1330021 RepID=A0A367L7S5_9HYPO|nr:hypothetical protein L249_4475 [Ophiocordyceps polyrhachis-furcata BCC 54312]
MATLAAFLSSLTQSLTLAQEATPQIEAIEHPKDGISLLDVKNELLLSYLQNLVFLILLKLRNSKTADDGSIHGSAIDETVREKLVKLRLYLEKGARPVEDKLRFSIERFLRTAENAQREGQSKSRTMALDDRDSATSDGSRPESDEENSDDDEEEEDATRSKHVAAAPRVGALIDDVTLQSTEREEGSSGIYRPPKRDRHLMDTTRPREMADRRPHKSHTMEEFVHSELSTAPVAEPSIGTTILQGGRKMKTAQQRKEEAERRDYEEMNLVRLPKLSKKERAKKNKEAGHGGRMQFGGEEWRDLGEGVDRIDRLTKRKGRAGGGVRALLEKSRKRGFEAADGHPEIGERFQKKVKMLEHFIVIGAHYHVERHYYSKPSSLRSIDRPKSHTNTSLPFLTMSTSVDTASASSTMTPDFDSDNDPVTATYQVFLNPTMPHGRRLLVLQQPNRTGDARPPPPPTEVRLKPDSGMVEVDIPLDTGVAYDREKGLRWGRSLKASMAAKNGGSHGLAGGFGLGAVNHQGQRAAGSSRSKGSRSDESESTLDWNDAVLQDKVLRTQTLGGQCPDADEVQHMVGVFRGNELHLTPVSSLVLLRPQPHHVDAIAQQERNAASAASKDAAQGTATAARAIHMTIKTATEGDGVTTETMADRLRFVQAEPWRSLRHIDENDEASWDVYNESLFLKPPSDKVTSDEPSTGTSSTETPADNTLENLVPKFISTWNNLQMLEHVSGITKPVPKPEPPKDTQQPAAEAKSSKGRSKESSKPDKGKSRC